jgi:ribosome-associated protein
MLKITPKLSISEHEISLSAMRAQGPGGQHVNKVASAIQLRFDVRASSLPEVYKQRLLALPDRRITKNGTIVIKSQQFRSQEQNREHALQRLQAMIRSVTLTAKPRIPTRPTRRAQQRRLDGKSRHGRTKALRHKSFDH